MELVETKYKQTEVGLIPEDWETIDFESLCSTFTKQTGFDYTTNIKPFLSSKSEREYLPFIQNKDFDGKWINLETDFFIPKSIAIRFPRILLNIGTLMISISGSIGKVGVFGVRQKAFIGGAIAVAKLNKNVQADWIMHFMQSAQGQKDLLRNVKAGSHQNLILEDIRKLKIPMPSREEQRAIATALSDVDDLTRSLSKLIEKKKAIKQGVMQELLTGKTRLPGFKKKDGFKQTEVGMIPEDWEVKNIDAIANVVGGGTPSTSVADFWNGDINWFTPTEIGKKKYAATSKRRITSSGLSNSGAKHLPKGTVLLTTRATIGDVSILQNEATTNQGFQSLVPKKGTSSEFLYYLMQTQTKSLVEKASGSTFLEISPSLVKSLPVATPMNIDEIFGIGEALKTYDYDIQYLYKELLSYKNIKQGMMQELLTGKTRLI